MNFTGTNSGFKVDQSLINRQSATSSPGSWPRMPMASEAPDSASDYEVLQKQKIFLWKIG
jgi:hypothetical protein